MKPGLYELLTERAQGRCEHCGERFRDTLKDAQEVDHFFGRANAEESPGTTWVLRRQCHRKKSDNFPSAEHWLQSFIFHAGRYGYDDALKRAQAKLEWLKSKAGVGA